MNRMDEISEIWNEIDNGDRHPVEIIYVAEEDVDLDELVEWGDITGYWNIRVVRTVTEAIKEQNDDPAEVMILLGTGKSGAEVIGNKFSHLPICIAQRGGFGGFPDGWPAQVVVAQWAAPRPGDFQHGIEDALGAPNRELIYSASRPDVRLYNEVSEELLARLTAQPQDRFNMDPRLFEETVAELLFRMGYEVQLTPRSGDKGRDIIANIATPAAPILMLVECKRYAPHRLIGPEPITRLWFQMFDDNANLAMLVTTSGFQPVAKKTAKARGYQISLKDGDNFLEWIRAFKQNPRMEL